MAYRYLMLFEKGQVTVAGYERRGKKTIPYITRAGEKTFPVTEDFWQWWQEAVSYIPGEPVDLCLLYDRDCRLPEHDFPAAEESCWNTENIQEYMTEMTDYSRLEVVTADGKTYVIRNRRQIFPRQAEAVFSTNLSLDTGSDSPAGGDTEEMTVFARYFREQLEERKRT